MHVNDNTKFKVSRDNIGSRDKMVLNITMKIQSPSLPSEAMKHMNLF